MIVDVMDAHERPLAERMSELLAGATQARFAVGYLFFDGLVPLRERLETLDTVDIVIGNVVNRLTEEQTREESYARVRGGEEWVREQEDVAATLRAERDRAVMETALNLRRTVATLPQTPEMRALILTLAGRIADGGLKVRLYTEGRIHAKLTVIGYPPHLDEGQPTREAGHLAVVGSSNLTMGATAHPTEINVVVRDPGSVQTLHRHFQQLWEASQDFHRELFDELGQSWALATLRSH